ncbi:MAG: tetratricopeptide repeat protein [Deltaproteobacteria bacterium]|nr:tetratricopeptide repeat protein [Deltaproteobacteria bacterium]
MRKHLVFILITLIFSIPASLPARSLEEGIIDPGLQKSWALIKANRPAEAIQFLAAYRPAPETRVYYHFCYGRALERVQKPFEAMEHYRMAYLLAPQGELKELAFLERAEGYHRIKNYYEAKTVYKIFLTQFNQSKYLGKAHLGAAQTLSALGLLPESLEHYEKAGKGQDAIFGRANILHRLGRLKEADAAYSEGISRGKEYLMQSGENLYYYGKNLQLMGREQESVQYLALSLKDPVFKNNSEVALGQVALKARKFDEAQKYLKSALTSSDTKIGQEALFNLAEAQSGAGKINEARQTLQEYQWKYPAGKNYEDILIKLARLDIQGERFEQASGWIKALSLRSPLKKETLSELEGFFLKMKEKDPNRMASLWGLVGQKLLNTSREPFLLVMAESLQGTGKLALLQWLVKNGSGRVKIQSLITLVQYYVEAGNQDLALEGLNALKNHKVTGDQILRLEARILHARMEYRAASERILSLKKMESQDLPLFEDTLSSAKDVPKALAVFEKNLRRLDGNANIYIQLADLLYDQGKKKEALTYYQKALEKDPLNEWALYRAGTLSSGEEAEKILGRIKASNSILSKLAKVSLREKDVQRKMGEHY